jgi:hypothetical protein
MSLLGDITCRHRLRLVSPPQLRAAAMGGLDTPCHDGFVGPGGLAVLGVQAAIV